jgi:hypothetical protein
VSYPTGDHQGPPNAPKRGHRPSLDRPSLFAGMEDETSPEDTQRVRILSTLESTRRATKPNRTKGGRPATGKSHRSSWLHGALWGAMGMGVLALMAGFVMVIQDTKPATAHPASSATTLASAQPPHATLPTPPATHVDNAASSVELVPPAAAGPAVIETTAPAPAVPEPVALLQKEQESAAATPAEAPAANKPAPVAPRPKVMAATPPNKAASKPKSAKGQDEDVALLEAMFAHTGRKAPPPHKN